MSDIKTPTLENPSYSKAKKKFFKFIVLIFIGFALGGYFTRRGIHLTPESFKAFVLSLGILGPSYASVGAALGGTVGFWFSRKMGHEYVIKKLKLGADLIDTTRFSFSVVFLLSLLPIMPVTVINYGAGLSTMKFKNYIVAHILGITPRAFAYGFFGSTLLEIGSAKFRIALLTLMIIGLVTAYFRLRSKLKKRESLAEEASPSS